MSVMDRGMMTGARKAAILLSLLGEDAAAPLLQKLSDEDLERVTEEVTNLGQVPFEATLQVLEEYQHMMTAQEFIAVGGQDVAVRLLVKAVGRKRRQNDGGAAESAGRGEIVSGRHAEKG